MIETNAIYVIVMREFKKFIREKSRPHVHACAAAALAVPDRRRHGRVLCSCRRKCFLHPIHLSGHPRHDDPFQFDLFLPYRSSGDKSSGFDEGDPGGPVSRFSVGRGKATSGMASFQPFRQ